MIKKILTVFDDPGGGLAVTAVAEKLIKDPDIEMKIFSGKLSEGIAIRSGLEFNEIGSMITDQTAEDIFKSVSPDLLLTATSGGNTEQIFRNIAFKKDIPSVVILDFWKDYTRRWIYADHEISEIKDKICVMDELTKTDMTEEGFPEKSIAVTGHPYLDKIFNSNKSEAVNSNKELVNILFLSQPLEIIGIKDYKTHPFKLLADAVSVYSETSGREVNIKFKLHPSEKMTSELSNILNEKKSDCILINSTDNNIELKNLINEADIIMGYNSIALFDARSMGKRVVSLNLFPTNEALKKALADAGIESVKADIEHLKLMLTKGSESKIVENIFNSGIENCLSVISEVFKYREQAI